MIKVSKEQHEYILSILNKNDNLKNRILKVTSLTTDKYQYSMDDDLEIDFNDFLQDKQIEIGYDVNYEPNEDWEKIQTIMDEIYHQTN